MYNYTYIQHIENNHWRTAYTLGVLFVCGNTLVSGFKNVCWKEQLKINPTMLN